LLNQKYQDLLQQTQKRIQSWNSEQVVTDNKATQQLLNDLKSGLQKGEEWQDFMLHFERLHPTFFAKLRELTSELTHQELKHCAYMRLGMSRKEVADLTQSSENAVKLARNRIRKKLGLAADASLQKFIDQV
jgi:DNA-binding NarL/FixJ family response regulator